MSPLREAIKSADKETIELLLSMGADPADREAFLYSIRSGGLGLDMLLEWFKPRYPRGRPGFGADLLIEAIMVNRLDVLNDLLAAGMNINNLVYNSKYSTFLTPLGFAVRHSEDLHPLLALLGAGADVNEIASQSNRSARLLLRKTALLVAIEAKRKTVVGFLLDKGADVNCPAQLSVKRTPLQAACEIGDWGIVNLLLDRGADVNGPAARGGGGTALQLAAMGGYTRIVELLLSRGASVHASPSVRGLTALEAAAQQGRLNMLGVLWAAREGGGFPAEEVERAIGYANEKGHHGCAAYIIWLWTVQNTGRELPGEAFGGSVF